MTARIHYGKRYEVSAWGPPPPLIAAADERTEGLVGYFLNCARHYNPIRWQNDLYTLARSCYMQGVMDAAGVAAQMRRDESNVREAEGDPAP